jgi:hypothetical protein
MKLIFLLCFLAFVSNSYEHRLVFPKELQDFRWEYLNRKGENLKYIDYSFFEVYNKLKSTLDQVSIAYLRYNATWDDTYNKFNMNSLKNRTADRLANLYGEIEYVLSFGPTNVHSLMNTFYVGLLGFESDPIIVAKTLWDLVEDHMNSISKLYARNKDCLKDPLKKYHSIYLRGISMIRSTAATTNTKISSLYTKVLDNAEKNSLMLKQMAYDLDACKKSAEVNECVKKFVSIFGTLEHEFEFFSNLDANLRPHEREDVRANPQVRRQD